MGAARIEGVSVRYYGSRLSGASNPLIVSAVLEGLLHVDPLDAGHAGERAIDCRRARHRGQRVAERAAARLHESRSRSSCIRAMASAGWRAPSSGRAAARPPERRPGRGAARRHAAAHDEQRSARRDRRGRDGARAGRASTSRISRSAATKTARWAWSASTMRMASVVEPVARRDSGPAFDQARLGGARVCRRIRQRRRMTNRAPDASSQRHGISRPPPPRYSRRCCRRPSRDGRSCRRRARPS